LPPSRRYDATVNAKLLEQLTQVKQEAKRKNVEVVPFFALVGNWALSL